MDVGKTTNQELAYREARAYIDDARGVVVVEPDGKEVKVK